MTSRVTRVCVHYAFMAGCLSGCLGDGGRALSAGHETAVPGIDATVVLGLWRTGVVAKVVRQAPLEGGAGKAAWLGLLVSPLHGIITVAELPDVYLLRKSTTSEPGLAEQPYRTIFFPADGSTPFTVATAYYQMPQDGQDWTLEQYALWFDPTLLAATAEPASTGIFPSMPVRRWRAQSGPAVQSPDGETIETSALTSAAVFRLPSQRTGFLVEDADGSVVVRFTEAPSPIGINGYTELRFQGAESASGPSLALSVREVRNQSAAGALWVVVSRRSARHVSIGALSCFTNTLPDDCERATPGGDALLHPLAEVYP